MKLIPSFALASLTALLFAPAPGEAQLRIGYLDSERVLAEAPAFAGVRATMEQEFAPYRQELDSLQNALQRADEEFRAQAGTLSDEARQQREQQIQQQFAHYQQRGQQLQQQVAMREQQLLEPVTARVRAVLEDVRREGNYSFIISPPDGLVLAVDPALDVTAEVIRRLGAPGQ